MLLRWLLATTLAASAVASPVTDVDLRTIGPVQPKGRVQDHPRRSVVNRLVAAGAVAIPFLVSKLEDETKTEGHVFDYWPDVRVGDVALAILCDFFLTPDERTSTVPGLTWDAVLERTSAPDLSAASLLRTFVATHGRAEIRRRIEALLRPYQGRFVWDDEQRCFRPAKIPDGERTRR